MSYVAGLILLFANLFTIAFTCQSFFDPLLLTWLQIEGMAFYFLDDIFGLHFALEAPEGILKGFSLLNSNLCQKKHLQTSPLGIALRIRLLGSISIVIHGKVAVRTWYFAYK